MVIDTDHFKVVNDTYSHHARVAVLRHNAADIAAASHAMDFVARFSSKKIRDVAAEHQFVFAELVARSLITSVATQVVEVIEKLLRYNRRSRLSADRFRPQRQRLLDEASGSAQYEASTDRRIRVV